MESNRNYGELCTKTYMKAIETMVNYKAIEGELYESNRNYGELYTHEDVYESNRNYGELCTKTCMKAIEAMANYARKPI